MLVAVINLGLKSIRCIIFDERAQKRAFAARPVHTDLRSSAVEQNASEWLTLCEVVVHEALSQVEAGQVNAITVTTSASCLVPVDEKGQPTYAVLMVSDSRAATEAKELETNPIFQPLLEKTQLRPTPDLMLPKILWLKKNAPESYAKTRYFFSPADFLTFHLTGQAVIDSNNALKYHAFEAQGIYQYDPDILQELGISINKLPIIHNSSTTIGSLTNTMAERLGLSQQTKVILSTYDALCALLGSGVAQPGVAACVSGTVTSVRTVIPQSLIRADTGILHSAWLHPKDKLEIIGGSNNLGGGLIEWHKQAFYYDTKSDPYDLMDTEAKTVPPGAEGLVFLPYLLGERSPVWDSSARGIMFGMDRRHTRAHFTRSVYESVAFSTRHILEHIMRFGYDIHEIRFSGGLARSPVVGQILAHVLQRPVLKPLEFETTSLGAHIITMTTLGVFESLQEACKQLVQCECSYEPDRNLQGLYADMFGLYKQLYEQSLHLQDARNKLMKTHAKWLDAQTISRENL